MGHDTVEEIMADKSEAETSDVPTTPTDGLDTSGDAVQLEVDSATINLDPENPDESAGDKEPVKPEDKTDKKPDEDPEKKQPEDKKTEKLDEKGEKNPATGEKPKQSKIQRKINRLRKEKGDAERKAEKLLQENEALKAGQDGKGPGKEPVEDDFEDYDKFTDALANFKAAKINTDQKGKEAGEATNDAQKAAGELLKSQLDGGRDKYKDFDDVALKLPKDGGPTVTQTMLDAMQDSEQMGDIAYHLGQNVEESARIAALSPIGQIKAIANIEAGLPSDSTSSSESESPETKISGAPDPIDTVGSTGKTKRDPDKMSQAEFETAFESGKL